MASRLVECASRIKGKNYLLYALTLGFLGGCQNPSSSAPAPTPGVYVVQYADDSFPGQYIVEGSRQRVPLGWYVFCVAEADGCTLIDTGPSRENPQAGPFRLAHPADPSELLKKAGLGPIRRVVLTHAHWDHAGGLGDYPEAKFYLAQAEFTWIGQLLADSSPLKEACRPSELAGLRGLQDQRRLTLVTQPTKVSESLSVQVVPGHTPGSLVVNYQPAGQMEPLVFAGDNVYLEDQLTGRSQMSRLSLKYGDPLPALRKLAGSGRILPGHDPQLLSQCKIVSPGVGYLLNPGQ